MHPSCLSSCPRAFSRLPVSLAPRGGQVSTGSEHRVPTEGPRLTMSTHTAPGSQPPPDPHTTAVNQPTFLTRSPGTCRLSQEPWRGECLSRSRPRRQPCTGVHGPCLQGALQDVPAAGGPAVPTLHRADPRIILYLFGPRPPGLSCSREQTCLTCFDPQSLAQGPAATA